jgi:hypothetical protein
MKVTITHLKAPWPAGAKPGDVVELQGFDSMPGWAVGKCVEAPDGAAAAHVHAKPEPVPEPEQPKSDAELLAEARAEIARQGAELAEVRAMVEQMQDPAVVTANQAAREKAAADAKAALLAEAKELGVKLDGRWSDERLADEVAKARAA